ncbi:DUF4097 domain-containing protein [Colwelliaceae bacterium BS250]
MNYYKYITGLTFSLLCAFSLSAKQVDQKLTVTASPQISIENLRGKVIILGTDKNEVWVSGNLDEKSTEFVFTEDDNKVLIQVKMPSRMNSSFWDNEDTETKLHVHVPSNSIVNFQGVSSDAVISNITNEVYIKTVSGNIQADGLSKRVELDSVSGDIKTKSLKGRINLNTVSGNIEDEQSTGRISYQAVSGDLDIISNAEEVYASVISGDLHIKLGNVNDATITSISGNVRAELDLADDGLLKMSTVSGDIKLSLQDDVNADFRIASNAGGRIINKLTDDKVVTAKYGPSSKLTTTTGTGSASVKASTVSGSIRLSY